MVRGGSPPYRNIRPTRSSWQKRADGRVWSITDRRASPHEHGTGEVKCSGKKRGKPAVAQNRSPSDPPQQDRGPFGSQTVFFSNGCLFSPPSAKDLSIRGGKWGFSILRERFEVCWGRMVAKARTRFMPASAFRRHFSFWGKRGRKSSNTLLDDW